ncbi:MAG: tRNA (adenosine(37)-N6)-dimethylallyltransferase MiaA, partial [Candidatus Margulisiibacteriota bacterium]
MNKTVVILGPTAVGKSKLAIELAKKINGEIISADSMQVYRGMDIGTAKPTAKKQQGIPHHLINVKNPDEEWTVFDFVEQTNKLIVEISKRGKTPIIVGGTGLYLWSLLEGYAFPIAPSDKKIREKLERTPLPTLYAQLSNLDPRSSTKIHSNDKKRIVRALEVYELTGKKISELQELRASSIKHQAQDYLLVGLNLPREQLYERINERVDQMMKKGLIEEVQSLIDKGYSKDLPSFQALGYKEAAEYLGG